MLPGRPGIAQSSIANTSATASSSATEPQPTLTDVSRGCLAR
jgi:hypothetical protein